MLSYVAATLIFPEAQPLLAPLTAMLVVQVTPASLLARGLDRVIAVVAGVSIAVGFATLVPLEWWTLGLLILSRCRWARCSGSRRTSSRSPSARCSCSGSGPCRRDRPRGSA